MKWLLVFVMLQGSEVVIVPDLPVYEFNSEIRCQIELETIIKNHNSSLINNEYGEVIMPICVEGQ